MDRGAWRAAVHGVEKSRTQLSQPKHAFNSYLFHACCVRNLQGIRKVSSKTLSCPNTVQGYVKREALTDKCIWLGCKASYFQALKNVGNS